MIRQDLKNILQKIFPNETVIIDYVPKGKEGDYSTNLAFKIAAKKGKKPFDIANQIARQIKNPMIKSVTVHEPGFINFILREDYLLNKVFKEEQTINIGRGKKILLEFVSSNPTGPITIVTARAAAVGDALVKVLNKTGFEADAEYYVNDGGRQIDLLAESVRQRMMELDGGKIHIPENGYQGEYIIDVAKEVKQKGLKELEDIKNYSVNYFVNQEKRTLENFGVVFKNWIRESDIYKKGYVEDTLNYLKEKNLTYLKDGALFFRSTEFGDDEDRVIIAKDGRHTYLLPDIAYHRDKINRNYDKLINVWGPDHHGYIKRLTGGVRALGYPEDVIKILIVQEVKLKKAGKYVTMSKRAGTFETLNDLLAQIPKDVVRFFFLMRSSSQHLDFDLDLALKESDENPVYYIQYAYARINSIINHAREKGFANIDKFEQSYIKEKEEIALVKNILKFPEVLEDTVRNLEPFAITYYLIDTAHIFHYFYQKHRVVGDDKKLSKARLALIKKTAETIKSGLDILGVSCPERM
jgi:arginyl-tRNA synthetase